MVKYEDIQHLTTEAYFNDNQFSIDAAKKKYTLNEEESYVKALKRVCDAIASTEKTPELATYWSERWFDEIVSGWWHPAGSIMQGAGANRNVSLVNCTTCDLGATKKNQHWDSLESIISNLCYKVAKYAAFRQGLGVEFSRLRPKGAKVLNSSNESQGAVHWMKLVDSLGYYVGQKGRIPAMLFSLSIKHLDIEEFITVKSDYTKIQNANISVQVTNDFYRQVDLDGDWELSFEIPEVRKGDKVYIDEDSGNSDTLSENLNGVTQFYFIAKKDRPYEKIAKVVKARYLLEIIAKNMYANGEPGIQNIDVARYYSNSDYVYDPLDSYDSRICSSNACCAVGETKILTNIGWLTIEEIFNTITKNDNHTLQALSLNIKDDVFELKPITNAWQDRNDFTVEVTVEENGRIYSLECSADHQVLTKNRGYVEASQLSSDDDIVIFI